MNRKHIRIIEILAAIVIASILGYLAYLPSRQKPMSPQYMPARDTLENANTMQQRVSAETVDLILEAEARRNRSPVYGLDSLINDVTNDVAEDADRTIKLEKIRARYLSLKRRGQTFWQSEKWMKEPEYYRALDTVSLAKECFARHIFCSEMIGADDPAYGFIRLEIFHNGFIELFQRDDMWKGILHAYYQATEKISPVYDSETVNRYSLQLGQLRCLYSYSPFRKQFAGHEREFLNANVEAIKKYITYLDTYDPKKHGSSSDESPFSYSPCSVVEVALMLAKQLDPQEYVSMESAVKSVKWKRKQTVGDVKQYLELVAGYFD